MGSIARLVVMTATLLCLEGGATRIEAQTNQRFVALSPDASRVATFALTHLSDVEQANNQRVDSEVPALLSQVEVRNSKTGAVEERVHLCASCVGAGLTFGPDSRTLAILSHNTRARTTSVLVHDGSETRTLATISGTASAPRWSPDGRMIAFLAVIFPRKEPGAMQPGSPLTGEIGAKVDVQRIGVVTAGDGMARLVSPPDFYIFEYDWRRDSSGFVATAVTGNGDENWWNARLVTITADAGEVEEIDAPPTQIAAPTALPDGKSVAFIGGLMSDRAAVSGEVFITPLTRGKAVNLTPGFPGSFTALARRGDGLAATAVEGLKGALFAIGVDSSGPPQQLWSTPAAVDSGSVHFDAKGEHVAFWAQDFGSAPVLHSGTLDNPPALTDSADLVSEKPIWRAKALEWTRGDLRLEGFLLVPNGVAKGLIVEAHGGPVATSLPDWPGDDLRGDLLKAGYALFLPNPRGSAGRGEQFKALVKRDFGGGDLDDILAGLDLAIKETGVARDRVGFFGMSYGGYLAMLANVRTNAFRAIVAGGGIADWHSYYGQNGIGGWMRPFFGASAYEDPAAYAAASPIGRIRNAKTPTFLFVGERDIETPPPQSLQYWNALRAFDVPSTLVVYPGEGHAISGPAHLADLRRRVIGWFDRWITP